MRQGYQKNTPLAWSRKVKFVEALGELMERSGLGDMTLLTKHAELLEATKVIAVVVGKNVAGGSVDLIVPDYAVQAKALDRAYRLRGTYPKKKEHRRSAARPTECTSDVCRFQGTGVALRRGRIWKRCALREG